MLWVWMSDARKSSASAMSSAVLGPSDTTAEKPTPLRWAQSSVEAVSAPDCDSNASGPGLAMVPMMLALSFWCGRWKPLQLGPSRCSWWRLAVACRRPAASAFRPEEMTSAARHLMRPATSSALSISSAVGRAITASSARDCASSARVPVMRMSTNRSSPV